MSQKPIAELFLIEISDFARRLQHEHPLMHAALQGRVTPQTVASYLAGLKCLFECTTVHLEIAAKTLRRERSGLVEYFRNKQREEDGHAAWAESDLLELERTFGVAASGVPNSMKRWVEFLGEMVRSQPQHYLVYMLFAEQITVQLGPKWVKALEGECGIPLSALSSVTRHVELDKVHVVEGRDEINRLLGDVSDPGRFVDTLRRSMSHFEAFFDELNLSVEQPAPRAARDAVLGLA